MNKAKRFHDFYRNIDDEEAWIREKKILISSEDYGRDLVGVRNLRKKHERIENEVSAHDACIKQVYIQGEELTDGDHLADPDEVYKLMKVCWIFLFTMIDLFLLFGILCLFYFDIYF